MLHREMCALRKVCQGLLPSLALVIDFVCTTGVLTGRAYRLAEFVSKSLDNFASQMTVAQGMQYLGLKT